MDTTYAQNLIKEIIEQTNIPVASISISEDKSGNTWFSVEVAEPHFFIARDGEALSALNHIVRKIVENQTTKQSQETGMETEREQGPAIVIDINDFQKKKVESIHAIAHMMAERARYFKSNIEVDPMPAFERRIVHEFLADAADIETESTGMGPSRRVVIKYKGSI